MTLILREETLKRTIISIFYLSILLIPLIVLPNIAASEQIEQMPLIFERDSIILMPNGTLAISTFEEFQTNLYGNSDNMLSSFIYDTRILSKIDIEIDGQQIDDYYLVKDVWGKNIMAFNFSGFLGGDIEKPLKINASYTIENFLENETIAKTKYALFFPSYTGPLPNKKHIVSLKIESQKEGWIPFVISENISPKTGAIGLKWKNIPLNIGTNLDEKSGRGFLDIIFIKWSTPSYDVTLKPNLQGQAEVQFDIDDFIKVDEFDSTSLEPIFNIVLKSPIIANKIKYRIPDIIKMNSDGITYIEKMTMSEPFIVTINDEGKKSEYFIFSSGPIYPKDITFHKKFDLKYWFEDPYYENSEFWFPFDKYKSTYGFNFPRGSKSAFKIEMPPESRDFNVQARLITISPENIFFEETPIQLFYKPEDLSTKVDLVIKNYKVNSTTQFEKKSNISKKYTDTYFLVEEKGRFDFSFIELTLTRENNWTLIIFIILAISLVIMFTGILYPNILFILGGPFLFVFSLVMSFLPFLNISTPPSSVNIFNIIIVLNLILILIHWKKIKNLIKL